MGFCCWSIKRTSYVVQVWKQVYPPSVELFQNGVKLPGMIRFLAYFGAAEFAPVFISVSIRQYQQKEFVDRHGARAIRTVQFCCLEFIEHVPRLAVAWRFFLRKMKRRFFHRQNLGSGVKVMILYIPMNLYNSEHAF